MRRQCMTFDRAVKLEPNALRGPFIESREVKACFAGSGFQA